jgi:hypothetical protein
MQKFVKFSIILLVICGVIVVASQYEYLKGLIKSEETEKLADPIENESNAIESQQIPLALEDEHISTPDLEKKQPLHAFGRDSTKHVISKEISCKACFMALDSIIIKFFQKENFSHEVSILQNINLPEKVKNQLSVINNSYDNRESNIVKNKIVSKMIRIEKTSSSQIKQEDFLNIIHDLQEYFYSPEFISGCKL